MTVSVEALPSLFLHSAIQEAEGLLLSYLFRCLLTCPSYHGEGVGQGSQTDKGGSGLPRTTGEVVRSP